MFIRSSHPFDKIFSRIYFSSYTSSSCSQQSKFIHCILLYDSNILIYFIYALLNSTKKEEQEKEFPTAAVEKEAKISNSCDTVLS